MFVNERMCALMCISISVNASMQWAVQPGPCHAGRAVSGDDGAPPYVQCTPGEHRARYRPRRAQGVSSSDAVPAHGACAIMRLPRSHVARSRDHDVEIRSGTPTRKRHRSRPPPPRAFGPMAAPVRCPRSGTNVAWVESPRPALHGDVSKCGVGASNKCFRPDTTGAACASGRSVDLHRQRLCALYRPHRVLASSMDQWHG